MTIYEVLDALQNWISAGFSEPCAEAGARERAARVLQAWVDERADERARARLRAVR